MVGDDVVEVNFGEVQWHGNWVDVLKARPLRIIAVLDAVAVHVLGKAVECHQRTRNSVALASYEHVHRRGDNLVVLVELGDKFGDGIWVTHQHVKFIHVV